MIIYTHQKSKKRKLNKKQLELKQSWEELVQKTAPKKFIKTAIINDNKPYRRETPHYPSLNSNEYNTFKKNVQHYTGDNMKGIGTLHKSNAVPIFTEEEARDQASMRR